jgi:hypothetical protein
MVTIEPNREAATSSLLNALCSICREGEEEVKESSGESRFLFSSSPGLGFGQAGLSHQGRGGFDSAKAFSIGGVEGSPFWGLWCSVLFLPHRPVPSRQQPEGAAGSELSQKSPITSLWGMGADSKGFESWRWAGCGLGWSALACWGWRPGAWFRRDN